MLCIMSKPKWSHYQTALRILRYVKGTMKHEVLFSSGVSMLLSWYATLTLTGVVIKLTKEALNDTCLCIWESSFLGVPRSNQWLHCNLWSWIHSWYSISLSACLANEFAIGTEVQGEQTNQVDDWQQICHKSC